MAPEAARASLPGDLAELPDGWKYQPLADLVDPDRAICYGIVQPGSATADGVPIVRVNNIRHGRIDTADVLRVTPEIEAEFRRSRLRGGEVLLTLVGSLGESAIVPMELEGWNIARAVGVIPVSPKIGARWVEICLRSRPIQHHINMWATTTVQATLNLRDVAKLPIPVPPNREREAIVRILGALDDKIELNRRTNETLEGMARTLFKSWFVDFDPVRAKLDRRPPPNLDPATAALFPEHFEHTELGLVPKGWAIGSLLDHAQLLSGGTPKTDREDYWGGQILWASAKDVSQCGETFLTDTERTITSKGLEESATQIIPALGTVVVARGATTGRMVMLGSDIAMNQTCYALVTKQSTPFALYCLMRDTIEDLVHAAHGSVFDTITTDTFARSRVVVPPPSILRAFDVCTSSLFHRVLTNLRQSRTLAALRDALLPKLLSGEIRVSAADKLVEEVA